MANLFTIPELSEIRREISIYRTPLKTIDKETIRKISSAFDMKARAIDSGSRIMVKDRFGVLEIFEASGSIWWTKQNRSRSERRKSVRFLSEKKAIEKANPYLKTVGLADRKAKPKSVSYTETFIERSKDKQPTGVITHQHVNYEFSLDDLPVFGPGAKIQVTFSENNQVVEVLKFWREPKKERRKYKLISIETAIKIFQKHEAFWDLSKRTAKIQANEISLGYYALPPREIQVCLIPVYRFKGFVSTKDFARYDFAKYVVAVDVEADTLKKIGGSITATPLVI